MRKRKTPNAEENTHDDDDDDPDLEEPEEFQDSGDDWNPEEETAGRGKRRNGNTRGSLSAFKKKRKNDSPASSADDDEEEEDFDPDEASDGNKSDSSQGKDIPKHFHSGNFVLLKSEVKWDGDEVISKPEDLVIWRIDGKALLQKYIPTEIDGKILHKCTCSYSGWTADSRVNYYPVTEILDRNPKVDTKEVCVVLNVQDLIKVRDKN